MTLLAYVVFASAHLPLMSFVLLLALIGETLMAAVSLDDKDLLELSIVHMPKGLYSPTGCSKHLLETPRLRSIYFI